MNALIKIKEENGRQLVSARELHEFLEVATPFKKWIDRMIEYGFEESLDYSTTDIFVQRENTNLGNKQIEYAITVDMAKEISMIQRTEKGKQARQYFIQCEKKLLELSQPKLPTTYKEALLALVAAEEEKEKLMLENRHLESEVEHKEDVIIGLVKDIDVAEKRQRISQIIRHNAKGKFQDRYNLLYSELNKKFHIDIHTRYKNALENNTIKKSTNKMAYICDNMNMTNELYEICCKIFENDVKQLMNEMWDCIA